MALRDFPNTYFAWYNDDRRLAILEKDTTSTDTSERTGEKYDTYQSEGDIAHGLRITFHSKYETITTSNLNGEMSTTHGLDTGMQNALLCYVKSRLFEDQGNLQQAQYFKAMFERAIKKYPSRKSGIRQLSVPRL
tara:strand:- start:1127 stop:1531 length:405 start_codon:yes stop_codon:yes gene_type:complete